MSASVRSRALLLTLVFISGMASLGVEFGASRLLAPYFGTSLYVWAVLMALALVFLSPAFGLAGRRATAIRGGRVWSRSTPGPARGSGIFRWFAFPFCSPS